MQVKWSDTCWHSAEVGKVRTSARRREIFITYPRRGNARTSGRASPSHMRKPVEDEQTTRENLTTTGVVTVGLSFMDGEPVWAVEKI